MFINYENYNFFFLSNLVVLGLYFYILIFSARIFNSDLKLIIFRIVLNLSILNLLIGFIHLVSLDNFSTFDSSFNYTDHILKERLEKSEILEDPYKVPSHMVLYKSKNERSIAHLLYTTPFDTTSTGSFEETEKYRENIRKNLAVLDTMINNLKFKRNKEFYHILLNINKLADSISAIKVIEYTENEIAEQTVYMNPDSTEFMQEIIIQIPDKIQVLNTELALNEIQLEEKSNTGIMPLLISSYFLPIQLLFVKEENSSLTNTKNEYAN